MNKKHAYAIIMSATAVLAFFIYVQSVQPKEFEHTLTITLEYDDGTTGSFSPENLPLLQNSIVDQTSKTVKNIQVELYAAANYEGTATGWTASGTLNWKILDSAKNTKYSISMPLQPLSGASAPPKNQPFVISSATVSADAIESMMTGWVAGQTYYLRFEVQSLSFTLKFSDGTSQTKTASAAFEWQFKYVDSQQFTSLSVTWQPVTYY